MVNYKPSAENLYVTTVITETLQSQVVDLSMESAKKTRDSYMESMDLEPGQILTMKIEPGEKWGFSMGGISIGPKGFVVTDF